MDGVKTYGSLTYSSLIFLCKHLHNLCLWYTFENVSLTVFLGLFIFCLFIYNFVCFDIIIN